MSSFRLVARLSRAFLCRPSPWESLELQGHIEKRSGKKELCREDVETLCKELTDRGVEEMGRYLKAYEIFESNPWEESSYRP